MRVGTVQIAFPDKLIVPARRVNWIRCPPIQWKVGHDRLNGHVCWPGRKGMVRETHGFVFARSIGAQFVINIGKVAVTLILIMLPKAISNDSIGLTQWFFCFNAVQQIEMGKNMMRIVITLSYSKGLEGSHLIATQ